MRKTKTLPSNTKTASVPKAIRNCQRVAGKSKNSALLAYAGVILTGAALCDEEAIWQFCDLYKG